LSKPFEDREARRVVRALDEISKSWWWFDPANEQHIHEFSAAWEILRRTDTFRLLGDRMREAHSAIGRTEERSFIGMRRTAMLMEQFRTMLPQSPPAPSELCDMVSTWQNRIDTGWTHEKTYLEARKYSKAECVQPDGKTIRSPPTYGTLNRGVPVILPRQVASRGHTELFVELCNVTLTPGQAPIIVHLAGSNSPTTMLKLMHKLGKRIHLQIRGKFIAIQYGSRNMRKHCELPVTLRKPERPQGRRFLPSNSMRLMARGRKSMLWIIKSCGS